MRVRFVQSGGVTGTSRACDLDTTTLPADDARELASLVAESRLPAAGSFRTPDARDLRTYDIRVESDAGNAAVTFDDHTIPDRVRPLVTFLRRNARVQGAGEP